jgi:hypothetical protein
MIRKERKPARKSLYLPGLREEIQRKDTATLKF